MHTFLSRHIYLQEFMATLAMLGLGLEGYATDPELPASGQPTLRRTP
jgi:hypothetical protein